MLAIIPTLDNINFLMHSTSYCYKNYIQTEILIKHLKYLTELGPF